MIRTILVAAAALASVSFSRHAEGAAAPWCAVINLGPGSVYWDCQYRSFEGCYRKGNILAGNIGFCQPSPYYVAGHQQDERRRSKEALTERPILGASCSRRLRIFDFDPGLRRPRTIRCIEFL